MEAGDRFGEYVIIQRLAAGGMAEVYLARRSGVGGFTKPLAMKVILPQHAQNKDFIKMFLDEARLCVHLQHANIAEVIDLGEVEGQYFIAMEFAHGMDLQQISRKTRKSGRLLPLPYAAKIISQVAEGLYYAHTKSDKQGQPLGIVHRDISPHNVILTFDGQAKLIDFGIAKATVTYKEEEEGVLKGKFSYMSPEQIRGMPIDPRSDIFALGIVLWEVCTGASLYRESSELLTMEAILRKPVPKPRELRGDMPANLEAIILKALAKRTVDRFQTAFDMHQALEGYLNHSGWNVGTPHLSEFMCKLFPEDYTTIRDLLDRERQKAEQEGAQPRQDFVAWEPYEEDEPSGEVEVVAAGGGGSGQLPPAPGGPRPTPPPVAPEAAGRSGPPWALIAIIVLLVLLLGVGLGILILLSDDDEAGGGDQPPAPAAQQVVSGELQLDSEPSGAAVYINGKAYGRAPVTAEELPLDEELTVRFEKPGYEDYTIPVRLSKARAEASFTADLNPE